MDPNGRTIDQPAIYEGWCNYETWAVALWVDNHENVYKDARRLVAEATKKMDPIARLRADAEIMLRGRLAADQMSYLARDLLHAAIARVNWKEIAAHWMAHDD